MSRVLIIWVMFFVVLNVAPAHAAPLTPTLVLGGKLNQVAPVANASYLSWVQNSAAHPNHYDTFAQQFPLAGSSPVKVNRPGTQGFTGGINGDTSESIYQEVANGHSNLYLYDLSSGIRTAPPSGINTSSWEWGASISTGYIEFGRLNPAVAGSPSKVLLYDRNTGRTITLGSEPRSCNCISPYQVTDRYATWLICVNICRVWYYDIAAGKAQRVPDPRGLDQYDPSVDGTTGTLFFAQAHGSSCGTHVKVVRWQIATPKVAPVTVALIPAGHDVGTVTYAYADPSGNDDLYFDQLRCSGPHYADIYEVVDAQTA